MKILIVTTELGELVPVGGIAEYVLGLATALLEKGHDVRVAVPLYSYLTLNGDTQVLDTQVLKDRLVVELGIGATEVTSVHEMFIDCPGEKGLRLSVLVLGDHKHFASVRSSTQVYNWPNHEPWIVFSRAIIELLSSADWPWQPDVIHCQDSHTALVPVYIQQLRQQDLNKDPKERSFASSVRTNLTIHNLLNQGIGSSAIVSYAGLPMSLFDVKSFEFYGFANCFKAGLLASDRTNTVSRSYAEEICKSHVYGFGLEGVMLGLKKRGKLIGIVNGIDLHRWKMKGIKYDGEDDIEKVMRIKRSARTSLYAEWGWNDSSDPVIAFRGRQDEQKGVILLDKCLDWIMERAKVLICTWGPPAATEELREIWRSFYQVAQNMSDRLLVIPSGISTVAETAVHYTISDFFLMPSKYEPCGLAQMECQRYGTIPVVRETGGLADTVSEKYRSDFPTPNGFVFKKMESVSMQGALERAIEVFHSPSRKHEFIRNTLRQRNGWEDQVKEYEELFSEKLTNVL